MTRTLRATVIACGLSLPFAAAGPPIAAAGPPIAAAAAETPFMFIRGMVVSCPRAGEIWGSEAMRTSLRTLKTLGVEWVAIHPYAWVRRDGELRFTPAAETKYLDRAVQIATEADVRLFWKPHLGYWGSFEWRGAIEFGDDEAAWQRFFDGYRQFIVDQAAFAGRAGVPIFAVGVETDKTVHREQEWREIIRAVRAVYDGEITYAANWDRVEEIPFWDAVDWIGVHAYFPLSTEPTPSLETIHGAWDRHLEQLANLSKRHGDKPVLLAEIGYNRSPAAAQEPWDYEVDDTPSTRALRRRLMEVALIRAEADPVVGGMFWWKWMPGTGRRRNFSMADEEARRTIEKAWASEGLKTGRQ